jgi:hypothetical protein
LLSFSTVALVGCDHVAGRVAEREHLQLAGRNNRRRGPRVNVP